MAQATAPILDSTRTDMSNLTMNVGFRVQTGSDRHMAKVTGLARNGPRVRILLSDWAKSRHSKYTAEENPDRRWCR
jgi:hypothetical protein